ncbi:hypothetical protein HS7_00610 [Sulfolobales archaeon HS-7]|nr:hypothetical protein HS7_00610 [Sulfolobales archaeon HS-7]
MRLIYYMIKRFLTNKYNWGYGVAFVLFWVLMGAYVFSSQMPLEKTPDYYYTAAWTGMAILMTLGTIGIGATAVVSFQTGSLSHLLRFSKLTSKYYVISVYAGTIPSSLVFGILIVACVYLTFSEHFGFNLAPSNMPGLLLASILGGTFMTSLSFFLNLIILKTSRKMEQLIFFIPLILSYLFGFGYLYLNLSSAVYLSPFTAIDSLIMEFYLNKSIPLNFSSLVDGNYLTATGGTVVSPVLAIASLVVWTVVLTFIGIYFVRSVYYKPLEEGRIA